MQVLTLMPFLVWYVLPGLNLLVACVVVPILVLNVGAAGAIFSFDDLVAAGVLAIVIGFIMDSVKLYRWSPGYRAQKETFQKLIASALEIEREDVPKIFEVIRADVRNQERQTSSASSIELDHSRWVMINHTSKTFFLAAAVWVAIAASHVAGDSSVTFLGLFSTDSMAWQLAIDGAFIAMSLGIGWRMQRVAYDTADVSDMNYLIYVRKHADRLRDAVVRFVVDGDPSPED